VLWARDDRVYVAPLDSIELAVGERVTFARDGSEVATGRVAESLHSGEVVMVTLTSGSLEHDGRLGKLSVAAGTSDPVRRSSLRVGIPGSGRSNLLFTCTGVSVAPPAPGYHVEAHAMGARMVRDSVSASLWPDTLTILLFGESADEEIALERGELDVAVFWPGELSTRMRDSPRWRSPELGQRSSGVVVVAPPTDIALANAPVPIPDSLTVSAINRSLFHGDLSTRPAWPRVNPTTARGDSVRFVAAAGFPGRAAIQRALDRGRAPLDRGPELSVEYVNASSTELRGGITPLFAIRCPVVCAPEVREYVHALGVDRFADLPSCASPR